jgi:hypothetical protein
VFPLSDAPYAFLRYDYLMNKPKPGRAFILQDNDLAILRGLLESRLMTTRHVADIHFGGRPETAKKRLQQLKAEKFVGERRRLVNEPAILYLSRGGLTVLRKRGVLADYPPLGMVALLRRSRVSELTVRHELEVMDVKAAFHAAARKMQAVKVVEFTTWPLLSQFEATRQGYGKAKVLVKPDGFIRIHEDRAGADPVEHTFFLEVDRSTEMQDTLISRTSCYLDYYRSGGFAARNGAPRSAYKDFPFRVLLVLASKERRNNIAERLLQSGQPIFTQVWLSTVTEVLDDPMGAIWIRPSDYRQAVLGTPFDPETRPRQWGYQKETARERFVENAIKKQRVISGSASLPQAALSTRR